MQARIWRWYQRHDKAVNALLSVACNLVPGAKVVLYALRGLHGVLEDRIEGQQQQKVEEMGRFLSQIKPEISDVVEEIEKSDAFNRAKSIETASVVIQDSYLSQEIQETISRISKSISVSVSRLSGASPSAKRIINEKYELLSCIGGGGQGKVYKAQHLLADMPVAVKLLEGV